MSVKESKLVELKKQIPFMWKVQVAKEYGATCVAYIDARDLFSLLDEVVGPSNWSTEYMVIKDQMFCKMGINIDRENGTNEWVYKMDTGTEANTEIEKSQVSDASKRVGVQWGIGRFLYDQEIQELKTTKHTNGKFYPVDNDGKILWDGKQLTEYINKKLSGKTTSNTTRTEVKKESLKLDTSITDETKTKIVNLVKHEFKGKDCLVKFLPEYNKKYGRCLLQKDLVSSEIIDPIIKFIEEIPAKV